MNNWTIELAPDYLYAVNDEPKREYLWLLSLTPKMDAAVYEKISRARPRRDLM
ncbi:MAG: lipocalin family protein [Burkholderiales bacterium]